VDANGRFLLTPLVETTVDSLTRTDVTLDFIGNENLVHEAYEGHEKYEENSWFFVLFVEKIIADNVYY
jgi:hypothetical protein